MKKWIVLFVLLMAGSSWATTQDFKNYFSGLASDSSPTSSYYFLMLNASAAPKKVPGSAFPVLGGNSSYFVRGDGSQSALATTDLPNSTSNALGVGTIELGHASDTTLARSAAGVMTVEGKTVKTLLPGTITDSATPYPSSNGTSGGTKVNYFTITALAQAAELKAPVGTWAVGEELVIAITGDATPRALTYVSGGTYIAANTTPGELPTTTVASKTIVMKFICNATTPTFWFVGYAGAF